MSIIDKIKLNGTTYDVGKIPDTTLTQSGQAADAKAVGDKLTPLIGGDEQVELTGWVYGRLINTGSAVEIGDTVDITSFTDWYSLKHVIVECQAGDKFLIDITGATNARAYAFLTSNNVLISRSDAGQAISGYITAPQNAGKVIIQGVYRQSPDDTTTDNGKAYKIVQGSGNVVRFDIAQDKTEAEKARARANIGIDSLEGAYISYDSEQDLTDEEIVQAQKNIGLIKHMFETVDLVTTVPSHEQTIFTSSDVNVGDKLLYHIKITHSELGYIALYNSQNTIIAVYGKIGYSQTGQIFDGEFYIPTGFSYAKWILSTQNNAQEFTLSKVTREYDALVYNSSNISRYYGKKVSIVGDSISTFNSPGYKIDGYAMFYPNHGVTDVNKTWWKMVIDASGSVIEKNASYSGSRVTNTGSTPDFYQRTSQAILGNPDLIFVALGVNDVGNNVALGEYDFDTEYTNLSEATFRTAYIKGIKSLKANFPSATIVAIVFSNFTASYRDSVVTICDSLNVECIITADYEQADYLHPNAKGMNQIARQVLYPTDTSLSQKHIAADADEVGKRIKDLNNIISGSVKYNADQTLTNEQQMQAQKNIGLLETTIEKDDLATTVPTNGQTLFTSSNVNVGEKLLYHIKMTVDDMAYIALYNSQNTIIAFYGKATYGQTGDFDGEFQIPAGFSYAKWITNEPNADEFVLSKVIGESYIPLYGNAVRYDIDQDLTSSQKTQAQKNIGLIETVQGKEDLITTVPVKNQILFTSSDVNAGDTLLYHIKMTIDDMAYIALYNSQNTIIAVYGKYTYGQTGNFDGEFQIPAGFSYAKWIINTPNAQEFILSKPVGELNVEIYARDAIRYDVLQDLSDSQKARARANIGVTSGGEIDFEEPFFTDVPMLYVTGTLPTAKSQGELPVMITYKSRTSEFTSYATLKVQGDSTSALPKKNFTIKLFKDSAHTVKDKRQFKTWSKYNKFVIKANYHDITHARNVVGARVWSDMVKSRSDYDDLPTEMLESDNLACIDGFPVMMYVNGQYYGRYAFNLTKDNMLNMDDSNPGHAMVQGQGYDAGTRFEEPITTNWSDELTDDLTHVETRWKEVLSFVGTSSDVSFKANLGNYFSVPSLIDFYLFGAAFFSYDSYGKNQSYLTYDGNYFICSAYDMDLTVGLHSSGHLALGATEPWLPYYGIEWTDNIGGHNSTFTYIANRLFWKLATLFDTEIKARWAELRAHDGALSFANIDKRFVEWCSLATTEQMTEDYASTTANGAFTSMANVDGGNVSTNNIRQIVKFMYDRLTYLDLVFAQNS